jgi:hypothetical protein
MQEDIEVAIKFDPPPFSFKTIGNFFSNLFSISKVLEFQQSQELFKVFLDIRIFCNLKAYCTRLRKFLRAFPKIIFKRLRI